MEALRLSIGCDHGGYEQAEQIARWLEDQGYAVCNRGTNSADSVDYPDYAKLVASDVAKGDADFGILVCGTGIGMQIAANKVKGVRAANVTSVDFAKLSRQHNNANVVTLSGRFVEPEENLKIVQAFLETAYEGGRHQRRIDKITAIEEEN